MRDDYDPDDVWHGEASYYDERLLSARYIADLLHRLRQYRGSDGDAEELTQECADTITRLVVARDHAEAIGWRRLNQLLADCVNETCGGSL